MTATLAFFALPAAFLVGMTALFLVKRRSGIGIGLGVFVACLVAGFWAIMQSRSSTAAIGILFLPAIGAIAGALGWAFWNLRAAASAPLRLTGWACLATALALPVWQIVGGVSTIERNQRRDAEQSAHTRDIENNRRSIADALAQNPGREAAVLERMIAERAEERAFLIPALASLWVSAEILDRMANSGDLGIVLTVVRNPHCPPATLTRVYRTHRYPDYFFQALADNPGTPAEILRELYARPGAHETLGIWLARNGATPRDILDRLSDTKDINRIQSLLRNPQLDCALAGKIEAALKSSGRPDDGYSVSRLAELKPSLCRPPS